MVSRVEWSRLVNGYIYSKTPPSREEKYWDRKIETIPRRELEEIRNKKVRALSSYLDYNSPFYHRKFKQMNLKAEDFKTVEDLRKGPLTVKDDWSMSQVEHPPFGDFECISMEEWSKNGFMVLSTGGTTSKPRLFMVSSEDKDVWTYTYARAFWAHGIRPGDVLLNSTVYGPFPGMWGSHYAAHWLGCPVIPGGGMDSRKRLFYLKECKVTVLIAVPSYVLHLTEEARKQGIDPAKDLDIDHVVMMAEPGACVPATKKRIEDSWSATTHDYFGHTEASMGSVLGFSCAQEDSHRERPVNDHVSEDLFCVEVVDPATYEPVGIGEKGVTVVTNLMSTSYPAFRYLMGDLMVYTDEPCECGRTFGRAVGGLLGRADDMLKIRGTVVYPSAIEDTVRSFKEFGNELEIVLTKAGEMDELLLRVEVADSSIPRDKWSELGKRLQEELSFALSIRCNVEILEPYTLQRFTRGDLDAKARRVRDLRPKTH